MIYFVRHGQSIWNKENRIQGHSHCPLSELGISQAENVSVEISKFPIKYFYSSDLLRARQTAEIIKDKAGINLEIVFDSRLREYNTGPAYQGKMLDERPKDYHQYPKKYDGESSRDVFVRAKNFMNEVRAKGLDDVLVVAHGGLIAMVQYILDNPNITARQIPTDISLSWYKEPPNCGIVKLNKF